MVSWRKLTGVTGVAAGAVAASVGSVVMAEKIAVGRLRLRPDPAVGEPFGDIRGEPMTVRADDGLPLHVEVSDPPGVTNPAVAIVFCHGYTLNQDVWYYQRAGLARMARLVFWDQRSHGRSGRSSPDAVTIDQLGSDLHQVMLATVPDDMPVVLVGHSMGGMTIMALADQHPELFGSKVIGAVLISTAAGTVDPVTWLPVVVRPAVRAALPLMVTGASKGRMADVVERARRSAGDVAFLGVRRIAFGDPDVSPTVVDFLERIIRSTPIDVIADFYAALVGHEKGPALTVLGNVPVLVLTGDRDRLVDPSLSEGIVSAIRDAKLVKIHKAGHLVILERPDEVNEAIADLVTEALTARAGHHDDG